MLTKVINHLKKDMRKHSINIYLTVLALYDNGVLIFGILMLGVPALYMSPSHFAKTEAISTLSSQQSSSIELLNYNDSNLSLIVRKNIICNKTIQELNNETTLILNESEIDDIKSCDISNTSEANVTDNQFYSPLQHYIRIVYPLALISQTGSIWTTWYFIVVDLLFT
jgi:hypothetical protein